MIDRATVVRWIREGPNKTDGTIGWFIGNWIWWRIWASMALISAPMIIGLLSIEHVGAFHAVIITAVVESILCPKWLEVSPKYNITKNY